MRSHWRQGQCMSNKKKSIVQILSTKAHEMSRAVYHSSRNTPVLMSWLVDCLFSQHARNDFLDMLSGTGQMGWRVLLCWPHDMLATLPVYVLWPMVRWRGGLVVAVRGVNNGARTREEPRRKATRAYGWRQSSPIIVWVFMSLHIGLGDVIMLDSVTAASWWL